MHAWDVLICGKLSTFSQLNILMDEIIIGYQDMSKISLFVYSLTFLSIYWQNSRTDNPVALLQDLLRRIGLIQLKGKLMYVMFLTMICIHKHLVFPNI